MEDYCNSEGYKKLKFIPKDKKLFLGIICGAKRSEVELFWRRFDKNDRSLSFEIVGSSPDFSTKKPCHLTRFSSIKF